MFAQIQESGSIPWDWNTFTWHLFLVVAYGLVGLAFFALTYLVIDKFTTFSLRKELVEDQNTALGVFLGAIFIAVAIILASAMRG